MGFLTRKERKKLKEQEEFQKYLEDKRKTEKMKTLSGGIAILFVFSLFPYVYFFQYVDFFMHKNQVKVENVRLVEQGWSDSLNDYAIKFHVDMEFGRYEADVVSFHTLVYKGDEFLGYLSSDIEGPILKEEDGKQSQVFETNTKRTLYYTYDSDAIDLSRADELFLELFYGDPNDYTFVVKLLGVSYTDGTTVGRVYLKPLDYEYDENGQIHFKN